MPIYSYNRYESTGQSEFAITFDYLSKDHIEVYLDGTKQTSGYSIDIGTNKVNFTSAPGSGTIVLIQRNTPKTKTDYQAQIADFQDGSVLTESDLDNAVLGLLYISQEAKDAGTTDALGIDQTDENWNAQNKRIKNVSTPTGTSDAVTKDYVDGLALYNAPSIPQIYTFTTTASQTEFVMSPAPTSTDVNTFMVDLDGVVQKPTTDFTISGSTMTLSSGTTADQVLTVRNFGVARDILTDSPSITGDLSVGDDLTVSDDASVGGNLTVTGTTTTVGLNALGTVNFYGGATGDLGSAKSKSTGSSLSRSLASRFAEVVNVKDFGATGNGTTDDSTAIQAAINYAESIWDNGDYDFGANESEPAVLYFPAGVYNCNNTQFTISPIGALADNQGEKYPARAVVMGDHRNTSIIKNGGFLLWSGAGDYLGHSNRVYYGLVTADTDSSNYGRQVADYAEISDLGFIGPWDTSTNNTEAGTDRYNNSTTAWFTNDRVPFMTGTIIDTSEDITVKVPWSDGTGASTKVPSTAIEIGFETRFCRIRNVHIAGYNYAVHDSSGSTHWDAATNYIENIAAVDNERGIVIHSSGWVVHNFHIRIAAKEGILIEAMRIGSRIENTQILLGECYNCGYGGLVIRTLEKDMNKGGRYTPANYADGVIPSETTEYGAGWLGDWGETTTNKNWDYGVTVAGQWTDPWGVSTRSDTLNGIDRAPLRYRLDPIVPYVFNTRVSQCAFGTTQGKNLKPWKVKALRKYSGSTILWDGDDGTGSGSDNWCEIEFWSDENDLTDATRKLEFNKGERLGTHFPRGIANSMDCTAVIKDSAGTTLNSDGDTAASYINNASVLEATATHKIVISARYSLVAPNGYVEGATLHSDKSSEISPVIDVVFGKGNREGMITDNRFNHTYMGGCAFYRFTNNRLKTSFWMADTCVSLSFVGSRTGITNTSYIGSTDWSAYHTGDNVEVYANTSGLNQWGDRLFNGPGASSGWVSMEMVSTNNTPGATIVPEIKLEAPKTGTTTRHDGSPEQLVGYTIGPNGINVTGLPEGTSDSSLSSGDMWVDTSASRVIKVKA